METGLKMGAADATFHAKSRCCFAWSRLNRDKLRVPAAAGWCPASAVFFALFGGCSRGLVPCPDHCLRPAAGGEIAPCPDPSAPIYRGMARRLPEGAGCADDDGEWPVRQPGRPAARRQLWACAHRRARPPEAFGGRASAHRWAAGRRGGVLFLHGLPRCPYRARRRRGDRGLPGIVVREAHHKRYQARKAGLCFQVRQLDSWTWACAQSPRRPSAHRWAARRP